ncbi:MAG: ectoine/hydroxyectoine ABC transporter permease subunit EhuD [Nocardioidaceae bacterium]
MTTVPLATDVPKWDMDFALDILPDLLHAFLRYTLVITVLATLVAAVLGLLFAVVRYLKVPVLAQVTTGFVQFTRATPIPVQLFFVYYLLPDYGLTIDAVTTGVLVLGVHYACYFAEVYRGGIESIPPGQWEACTALSLPQQAVWRRVVLPQAVRKILPSLGNYVISMFKEVPFLVFISVPEMVSKAQGIGGSHFRYVEPFTICGIIYLLASYPASVAMRKLETRLEHV